MEPPRTIQAVDVVPHWSALLGGISVLGTVVQALASGAANWPLLMGLLLMATLGATLGICGTILAVRDRRNLVLALVGTVGSLVLPLYMLAGMPWH